MQRTELVLFCRHPERILHLHSTSQHIAAQCEGQCVRTEAFMTRATGHNSSRWSQKTNTKHRSIYRRRWPHLLHVHLNPVCPFGLDLCAVLLLHNSWTGCQPMTAAAAANRDGHEHRAMSKTQRRTTTQYSSSITHQPPSSFMASAFTPLQSPAVTRQQSLTHSRRRRWWRCAWNARRRRRWWWHPVW